MPTGVSYTVMFAARFDANVKLRRGAVIRVVSLAECADVLAGLSTGGRLEQDPHGTHQVLFTKHLTDGLPYVYQENHRFRIVPGRDAQKYEVKAGDVLFMSRGTRNLAWEVRKTPVPTIAPVSFYILRPRDGVDSQYLAWYLTQPQAQTAIDQIRTGGGTPIVQRKALAQLEVVLPSLAVQRHFGEMGALMARERDLRRRLSSAVEREHAAIGRKMIENLRAGRGAGNGNHA